MGRAEFRMHPGALETILRGPQSMGQKRAQGERVAQAWRANIKRVTGATDRSIQVEDVGGGRVEVAADMARDPESAWLYLEYGTSRMRAQAPARRAIRGGVG